MFRFFSIILVVGIIVAGYFFLSPTSPLHEIASPQNNSDKVNTTEKTATPALESITNAQNPVDKGAENNLQLPQLTVAEAKQAKAHVDSITAVAEQPISITQADHFVSADQILQLPITKAPEIVKIESSDSTVALIVSAPAIENENLSDVKKNEANANTAQSFAVKIPSFKKTVVTQSTAKESTAKESTETPASANQSSIVKIETMPNKSATNTSSTQAISANKNSNLATESVVKSDINNPPQPAAPVDKTRVLATVVGEIPKPIIVSTSEQEIPETKQVPTNATVTDSQTEQPIMDTLKKNIAEISDIKVEELKKLVKEPTTIKESGNSVIKAQASIPIEKVVVKEVLAKEVPAKNVSNKTQNTTQDKTTLVSAQKNQDQSNTDLKPVVVTSSLPAITKPTTASLNSTQSEKNRIKLRELLDETQSDQKRIFYLHAVNVSDEQGIWGIIQKGLMGTFSKGIKLPTANGTLKALIPQDADEQLSSKESSFLGKLLNYKVLTTYVYNYEQGNIGKNPDYIKPGQQLIIVTFTEQELMSIYQHFIKQESQQ